MMRNVLMSLLGLVVLLCLSSCRYNTAVNESKNSADSLLLKTIHFPNSLVELKGNEFGKIDSFISSVDNKNKLISIVDGSCMSCVINHLNVLDSVFNSIVSGRDYVFKKHIFTMN